MDHCLKVKLFYKCIEVVGVSVHIVAIPGLARPAVSAAVMGDAAVSMGTQKQHLVFPSVRVKRPAMAEDHGLSAAPVLVVDLCAVFHHDRVHKLPPFLIFTFLQTPLFVASIK